MVGAETALRKSATCATCLISPRYVFVPILSIVTAATTSAAESCVRLDKFCRPFLLVFAFHFPLCSRFSLVLEVHFTLELVGSRLALQQNRGRWKV